MSNYYMYSYESIPATPCHQLWYASWSTKDPTVVWSSSNPDTNPDGVSSWVVAVCCADYQPDGAMPLSNTGKGMPPPPSAFSAGSVSDFTSAFNAWADSVRTLAI